jgi:hypothetical protein
MSQTFRFRPETLAAYITSKGLATVPGVVGQMEIHAVAIPADFAEKLGTGDRGLAAPYVFDHSFQVALYSKQLLLIE